MKRNLGIIFGIVAFAVLPAVAMAKPHSGGHDDSGPEVHKSAPNQSALEHADDNARFQRDSHDLGKHTGHDDHGGRGEGEHHGDDQHGKGEDGGPHQSGKDKGKTAGGDSLDVEKDSGKSKDSGKVKGSGKSGDSLKSGKQKSGKGK